MSERDSVTSMIPFHGLPKDTSGQSPYPLKLRIFVLLICFAAGVFTQYQSVGACVFIFHSTFLAFLWMEQRKLVQWMSVLFVSVGLTLSMSQLFRADFGPSWSWLSVGVVSGIQFAACHLFWILAQVHCRLARRFENFFVFFAYPVLVVAGYSLVESFSPVGSQASIGYALGEWMSFVQIVSVFGLAGLNFIILVSAVSITHVFLIDACDYTRKSRKKVAAICGVSVFFGNWLFGSFRLASPFIYQKSVVETATPSSDWINGACIYVNNSTDLIARTETVLKQNADIPFVIWSEAAAAVYYDDTTASSVNSTWQNPLLSNLLNQVQNLSDQYNATIAFTYSLWAVPNDLNDNTRFNMLSFVDPNKGIIVEYSKHHPVPIIEGLVIASDESVASGVSSTIGPFNAAICFDFDYPAFIRQGTNSGLLIQSANTWGIVGHFHSISSSFRAIENGAYLLRCGSMGPSAVYDIYGNSLTYQSRMDEGVIFFQIPRAIPQTWTFYSKAGFVIEYFFYAFSALYLLLFIATFRHKPACVTQTNNV